MPLSKSLIRRGAAVLAPVFLLGLIPIVSAGCASRSITKPRSQLIAEARSRGNRVLSVRQERSKFFQHETENRKRLEKLLRERAYTSMLGEHYRIGAGDQIELNVFDVPELNVTVRVRDSGFVSLPLIGAVRAAGRSEDDLQQELRERLEEYVKEPQLSVFIAEYGSQKVAVLGAVEKPGTYSLKKGANSLLELLGRAGGASDKAGNYLNFVPVEMLAEAPSGAEGVRARYSFGGITQQRGLEIHLQDILGTAGNVPLDIPIRAGDMIIVPESGKVLVEGEVEQRGAYDLGQKMSLLGALAAAGGITPSAKIDEVEVIRTFSPTEKAKLVLNLEDILSGDEPDLHLRNGDLVRVPSDSGRRMTHDTFEGISRLIRFGVGGTLNVAP